MNFETMICQLWQLTGHVIINSTQLKFIENGSRMAKRIQNTVHNKLVTTELVVQCRKCQVTYGDAEMNKKLSYRRGTARQLHTSFSANSLIVHFPEHRICFTTIQGGPN